MLRPFRNNNHFLQLLIDGKHSEVSSEVECASRSAKKLGSLLFEMEVLRSFLETKHELKYFDRRVMPCKIRAYVAIQKLKGSSTHLVLEMSSSSSATTNLLLSV